MAKQRGPVEVAAGLLSHPQFVAACRTRDVGTLFRLLQQHGLSTRRIAAAADISQGAFYGYTTGGRQAQDIALFERIADGFRIPGHLLGLARRTWEADAEPAPPIPIAGHADPDLAAMDAFRKADLASGGGRLYSAVVAHLNRNVAPRLMHPDADDGAYVAAAGLSEMAGWAAHDRGDDALALRHFGRALPLARTAGDEQLAAHIAASTSTIALHAGDSAAAVHWASTGLRHADRGAPLPNLTARLHAVHGRALAAVGEQRGAEAALDEARGALGRPAQSERHPWLSGFDLAALATETTAALVDLQRYDAAAAHAERAVALRDGGRVRSRALAQIGLATVHAARLDLDAAVAVGGESLAVGSSLSSVRVLQELDALRSALAPHAGHPPVAGFLEQLGEETRLRSLLLADLMPLSGGTSP